VLQRNCCKFLGARECSAGEVIFREGDCCDTLYIIVDGEVLLSAAAAGSSSSSGGRQPQQRVSHKGWLLSRRGRS
jgi:CRP-like cAMP-binding protein